MTHAGTRLFCFAALHSRNFIPFVFFPTAIFFYAETLYLKL